MNPTLKASLYSRAKNDSRADEQPQWTARAALGQSGVPVDHGCHDLPEPSGDPAAGCECFPLQGGRSQRHRTVDVVDLHHSASGVRTERHRD